MLCENCGKNIATTHIKRIVNGVKTEKHLCNECANDVSLHSVGGSGFSDIFASMFGDNAQLSPKTTKKCECCGTTFNGIIKTGKVGCTGCYSTFLDELLPYLKRIHGTVRHIGKIPNKSPLILSTPQDKLVSLRAELSRLVAAEEFEKAAVIRDEIKKTEGQVKADE